MPATAGVLWKKLAGAGLLRSLDIVEGSVVVVSVSGEVVVLDGGESRGCTVKVDVVDGGVVVVVVGGSVDNGAVEDEFAMVGVADGTAVVEDEVSEDAIVAAEATVVVGGAEELDSCRENAVRRCTTEARTSLRIPCRRRQRAYTPLFPTSFTHTSWPTRPYNIIIPTHSLPTASASSSSRSTAVAANPTKPDPAVDCNARCAALANFIPTACGMP